MKDDHSVLMFCHIPKAAGTTFNLMLSRYFGSGLIVARPRKGNVYLKSDFESDTRLVRNPSCIRGHCVKPFVGFGNLNAHTKWCTFLRDPKKRYVSHYIHQKTSGRSEFDLSIEDWSRNFNRKNFCVRMLAGEEDLLAAKQILNDRFDFVGLVEEFAQSVSRLRDVFGLSGFNTRVPKSRMVTRDPLLKREILSRSERYHQLILEENFLDIELYNYVLAAIKDGRFGWAHSICSELPAMSEVRMAANVLCSTVMNKCVYPFYQRMF